MWALVTAFPTEKYSMYIYLIFSLVLSDFDLLFSSSSNSAYFASFARVRVFVCKSTFMWAMHSIWCVYLKVEQQRQGVTKKLEKRVKDTEKVSDWTWSSSKSKSRSYLIMYTLVRYICMRLCIIRQGVIQHVCVQKDILYAIK